MTNILSSLVGQKGPDVRNAFQAQKRLLGDGTDLTIFDVGAYVGDVTAIYRDIFPKATIYCFEPFPESFEKLSQLANGGFIRLYQIALCESDGGVKLQVNSDRSSNSLLPRPQSGTKYYSSKSQNVGQIEVETRALDTFCDGEGISEIDILKLDVEGSEIKVLTGASKKLANQQIRLIFTEVMFVSHYEGGCLFHEVSAFLRQYGYTLFNLYNLKRARNGQLRWGNATFLSPEIRARIEAT